METKMNEKPRIKLQEIIWEVTTRCSNNCWYCGSSHIHKDAPNPADENIFSIAQEIGEYPDKLKVNISGGDPLELSLCHHQHITKHLEKHEKAIIVHPRSLDVRNGRSCRAIFMLYDYVGISVNSDYDLEILGSMINGRELARADGDDDLTEWFRFNKFTVITNFNKRNIYLVNEIDDFCKKYGLKWQVQFTMNKVCDNESDDNCSLYNDTIYLKKLASDLANCKSDLVLADNMNDHPCTAGWTSLGINSDGDVLSCLSRYSWDSNFDYEGNILEETLESIWKTGFYPQRFKKHCTCCKDISNSSEFMDYYNSYKSETAIKALDLSPVDIKDVPILDIVMMYGVFPVERTPVQPYPGQPDNTSVMAYAVQQPWPVTSTYTISTTDVPFTYTGDSDE